MDWMTDIILLISWAAVIIIAVAPSSRAKKIQELEGRIEELEKELKENK